MTSNPQDNNKKPNPGWLISIPTQMGLIIFYLVNLVHGSTKNTQTNGLYFILPVLWLV
jgi:hypothetical protein